MGTPSCLTLTAVDEFRDGHGCMALAGSSSDVSVRWTASPDALPYTTRLAMARDPQAPFSSRDYEGLKSEPEHGPTWSNEILHNLEWFRADTFEDVPIG